MKKILYLPALAASIAIVVSCTGCGGGVHPPAKKDTTQDTSHKATTAKPDTAAAKAPATK